MTTELETRAAEPKDLPQILELLRQSMGRADDDRFEALFRWKHLDNAFGPSPMWVACDGERLAAFRTFMRWEFQRGDEVFRCVRAVDTATHPDYQGRGLFTRLTRAALPELAADGVKFVFNTPNDQSRPGYLKMGWQSVGRASVSVRPLSVGGAVDLVRSRVAASHWSEVESFGESVGDVLGGPLADRLSAPSDDGLLHTRVSLSFLQWRYAAPVLSYRAVVAPGGIDGGVALTRVRRRGRAREIVVGTLLGTHGDRSTERTLLRHVRKVARGRGSYLLAIGALPGFIPVPGFGPILTTREVSVAAPATVADFALTLGDIELF